MCGKGFTRWNFPAAKKALRAWIEAQRAALPPAEPLFTEDPARLDWMFFSSHQLFRFFRYRAANPSPLFAVERVSGSRKKEEIWEVRNRGYAVSQQDFAPYAEAYSAARLWAAISSGASRGGSATKGRESL